ncbi:MAG TPA: hypothetical protein VNJ51_00340 [Candidatus Dormibacteraeota bacterium]|nr:hypothetical protein [Candidatus Dormibacteraeota bacterium]
MKSASGFLIGVIVGLVAMFALVKLGYVHVPAPTTVVAGETPAPQASPAPVASAQPSPASTAASTGAPGAGAGAGATPAPIAGSTYAWNGPEATITYAFHGDGTYDANYAGRESGARIVGISKGTWTLDGPTLSTHETSGVTRRTAAGSTTTRPEGAGDVTFTVGDGTITDAKGRIYNRL